MCFASPQLPSHPVWVLVWSIMERECTKCIWNSDTQIRVCLGHCVVVPRGVVLPLLGRAHWLADAEVWEPHYRALVSEVAPRPLEPFGMPTASGWDAPGTQICTPTGVGCRKHMTPHTDVLGSMQYCYWFLHRTWEFWSNLFRVIPSRKKLCVYSCVHCVMEYILCRRTFCPD